ncbi:KAP family P-loop domain-containing protein [Actinacidiphila yanglinensis]|uniref:KAP family P-loop domain-containing protein n=1 Tax=Actinacidiphila yanglinensis TaxID=310779 RepID=A0A1H5UWX2_9ACTN|nr:P-loop NTPase fold protein [Actinacidiphila yanglinensis]SEF79513.1 KAP family P-loop domain-containing protein [Actinacidiphila yanglinensis]
MAHPPSHGLRPAVPGAVEMRTRSGLALLNDEPVSAPDADQLGAGWAAAQLSALLLASRDSTPFSLAVEASWGMGKSSLMRLMDAQLRETGGVHTVWYNAWSSTGADALEGLIKSVLAQFDRNILRRALRRMQGRGGAARLLRALTLVAAGPLGVAGMVDALWRALSADATTRNDMREALRTLVAEWTAAPRRGAPGRLLVIFIDDLDRCSQETVLTLCEALKVYLDVPGLAFVIGCDREAMSEGGMLDNLSPAGTAFMEKIFQTSYRIPAPSSRDIEHYVQSCAEAAGIADLLDHRLVVLLGYRAARNPRRVKRLVNGLLLEANLNPIWYGLSTEAVIRTLLLQYLYIDFYRLMTTQNEPGSQPEVVDTFVEYTAVRRLLRAGERWGPEETVRVGRLLSRYAMALPEGDDPQGRTPVLRRLEGELPELFPTLAADPMFVSLLRGLMDLEGAQLVLQRLREGVDMPTLFDGEWQWEGELPAATRGDAPGRTLPPQGRRGEDRVPGADRASGEPAGAGTHEGRPAGDRGERPSGDRVSGDRPGGGRTTSEQAPDWNAVTTRSERPAGTGQPAPRTPSQQPPRPAGPADPVSTALDPLDTDTFPPGYAPPAGYAQRTPPSSRTSTDGRGTRRRPVVVVVGFPGAVSGPVALALDRRGLDSEQAFNQVVWDRWLARRPQAVLCHVAAFGVRGQGFELVRAARRAGYDGAVVFHTPSLTPNERRAAEELGAGIAHDTDEAVGLLLAALGQATADPSASSG